MNELLAGLDVMDWLTRAGISFLRTSGLMLFVPIFGAAVLPRSVRLWLAVALAAVLTPFVPPLAVRLDSIAQWGFLGLREVTIGVCLGTAARILFGAFELAAQLVSGQSGFTLASMVDPVTGGQSMAPALLMMMLSSALFLAADLHHLFIDALRSSYEILPPALTALSFAGFDTLTSRLGIRLFTVAVELAAPAMVLAFAMDLLLGLVGRTMPRAPIILVGYPAKLGLAVIGLGLLVYGTGASIGWLGRAFAADAATILSALAGHAG